MTKTIRCFTTLFLLSTLISPCLADEVNLNSGEKLIGTVVSLAGGKLIFKSGAVGTVTLAVKDIRSLTTDAPVTLLLADGTRVQKKMLAGTAGKFSTEPGGAETALTTLRNINPPPPPRYPFHGNAALGLSVFSNTVNSTNFSATTDVARQRPNDKIVAGISYVRSRQGGDTTADSAGFNTQYDFGLQRRLYGFANAGLRTDRVQNLTLRTQLGGGVGYQWIRRPSTEFSTTAGLSYLSQKFKEQSNQSKLTTQFGSVFDTKFAGNTHFRHTLSYFPNISDVDDYYLVTQFILERTLGGTLTANVRYLVDYTSRPGPNSKSSTSQFIVGVGKSF
jgi:putative salt-induced outer membrane protein YdiY